MTAVQPVSRTVMVQSVVIGCGVAVLVLRPFIGVHVGWTTASVAALFAALLLAGLVVPVPLDGALLRSERRALPVWVPVLLIGAGIFVVARLAGAGHRPAPLTMRIVGLNSLAAVAEEALLRRLAYGALLVGGTTWAVAGSALLFGLVHVTVYGWWALPIDLAAGLLLSWQRLASGTWAVPAATHVLADLLVVI
jgi:Type II CAAX prenyl endopeptidase Rce1-like